MKAYPITGANYAPDLSGNSPAHARARAILSRSHGDLTLARQKACEDYRINNSILCGVKEGKASKARQQLNLYRSVMNLLGVRLTED